jgi:hypothetical protein
LTFGVLLLRGLVIIACLILFHRKSAGVKAESGSYGGAISCTATHSAGAVLDPRVAKGTTVSANKSGEAMELTYELKGKATETDRFEVSDGGKTLTETVTYAGVSKPEVDVTIGSKGKAACA